MGRRGAAGPSQRLRDRPGPRVRLLLQRGVWPAERQPPLAGHQLHRGFTPAHRRRAGVRLAWVIDPAEERAVAYRSVTGAREIPPEGSLDGEDLLPGFRCPLRELFE